MAREHYYGGRNPGENPDEIDRLFGGASPNPSRDGCPPPAVLQQLARKQRQLGDPTYDHLAKCSPCYREFRRLQTPKKQWSQLAAYATAAIAVFLLASFVSYIRSTQTVKQVSQQQRKDPPAQPRTVLATADLRGFSQSRELGKKLSGPPLRLTRGLLSLTLMLPVGSEPGQYALVLLRPPNQRLVSTEGKAAIVKFITTLNVSMDLRNVPPGRYNLEIKRLGEQPEYFPADVY